MFENIDENINLFKTLTKEEKIKYIDYLMLCENEVRMIDKFKSNTL